MLSPFLRRVIHFLDWFLRIFHVYNGGQNYESRKPRVKTHHLQQDGDRPFHIRLNRKRSENKYFRLIGIRIFNLLAGIQLFVFVISPV